MIFLKSSDCPTANLQGKENLEKNWSIKTFFRRILILKMVYCFGKYLRKANQATIKKKSTISHYTMCFYPSRNFDAINRRFKKMAL